MGLQLKAQHHQPSLLLPSFYFIVTVQIICVFLEPCVDGGKVTAKSLEG